MPALLLVLITALTSCSGREITADQRMQFIYSAIWLVFMIGGLVAHFRHRPITALKSILIWTALLGVIIFGYSYRFDLRDAKNRILGELSPATALVNPEGALEFRVSSDGHFHIAAKANGQPIEFLLDTGASDVVLTKSTAQRIGIDPDSLNYTKTYHTANGTVRGAPVVIRRLQIGDTLINDVRASVNEADMQLPLLGMSFLEKLKGYEVKDGILTLRP